LLGCKKELRDDPKTIDTLLRVGQQPVSALEVQIAEFSLPS